MREQHEAVMGRLGRVRLGISGWALEEARQGIDHGTKPDRVQEAFG